MKFCALILVAMLGAVPLTNAQTIQRVSGRFLAAAEADAGGFMTYHSGQCCEGADAPCDVEFAWPTSAASVSDADHFKEEPPCGCIQTPNEAVCGESTLALVSASSSEKHVVWEPKIHVIGGGYSSVSELAYSTTWAFNDLVLSLTVPSNPTRLYTVQARVIIETQDGGPVYVLSEAGKETMMELVVDAALSANATRQETLCGSEYTVSEWDDVALFSQQWAGGGCQSLQVDQDWTPLGMVCPGANFRLGFRMMLSGEVPYPSGGVCNTQGDDSSCWSSGGCAAAAPLRVVFAFRVIWDGVSTCD